MRNLIRKLIYKEKSSSESYVKHLRSIGVKVGEDTVFYDPIRTHVDETRPFMLTIGNGVKITRGVTILTHGYDWSVLKKLKGEVVGSAGEVVIGNNVFIGMNATILKNVHIGDNVIIGANSLVNKDLESGCVYAGNPAKKICTVEEYFIKRKNQQLSEARSVYKAYVARYNKQPPVEVFDDFFWLFWKREETLPKEFVFKMKLMGNFEESMIKFKQDPPKYDGYEEFLRELNK